MLILRNIFVIVFSYSLFFNNVKVFIENVENVVNVFNSLIFINVL